MRESTKNSLLNKTNPTTQGFSPSGRGWVFLMLKEVITYPSWWNNINLQSWAITFTKKNKSIRIIEMVHVIELISQKLFNKRSIHIHDLEWMIFDTVCESFVSRLMCSKIMFIQNWSKWFFCTNNVIIDESYTKIEIGF